MSMLMNKGIKMSYKTVKTQVYTVLGILVKILTYIAKPKGFI